MRSRKALTVFLLFLCVSASLRLYTPAQIRPVYDQGALGLAQLLKRLNTTASALMIGAHPDDEDTALLTYLARGENARTAYLSLTRGDGGQNILGPELGEALGVIRTEELLQARKLDGAEQYFTRAYDYGFSKTLAEAKAKWDEKIILCDVVRVIRSYQPLVVISQFSGTPADGHGQHQYAGYITPLAVKAAAEPAQCREAGPAWTVKKFYVRHRGQGEPTLRINTGKYDPLLGRSYFEIAMHARSQHRSQEQGVLELKGDQFSSLNMLGSNSKETSVFDSLEDSISAGAHTAGMNEAYVKNNFSQIERLIGRAVSEYDPKQPERILPILVECDKEIEKSLGPEFVKAFGMNAIRSSFAQRSAKWRMLGQKRLEVRQAILLAGGTRIDALADRETVVPGETVSASVNTFFGIQAGIKVSNVKLVAPAGWTVASAEPPASSPNSFRREVGDHKAYFTMTVPADAIPTQPYWLKQPRDGDLFRWEAGADDLSLPVNSPVISAEVTLDILGREFVVSQPVEYRFADDVRGELRRPLEVVPRISLSLDQELVIVPRSERVTMREMNVTVTNNSTGSVRGEVIINPPSGGAISGPPTYFTLTRKGETVSMPFTIEVPANAAVGKSSVNAVANVGRVQEFASMRTISYPHIQTHRIYATATAWVNVLDLKTTPVRVGYVRGSGDRVPEAIKQLGLDITEIDERTLATGDLSRFDTIVVGIRAYQVRPDLVANNQRLLDFAKNGGTLIVQYQLPATFPQQNLAPYPAQLGPRVADENAVVTIVDPAHPVFNFPNKISSADFEGWVQERNLYNFSTMDPKYVGLLESHDAGEPENKGGLVVADVGKGKYIYCSYSLFRQLPAGVPGAYRLLANLLSLQKAEK